MKDGTHIVNRDGFKSIGTHWIALYANGKDLICFDSKKKLKVYWQ